MGRFRLVSKDQKSVCQFKLTNVVFSMLKPYAGWDEFTNAAMPFWNAFVEWAGPSVIDRIGVRFISQIDLSGGNLAEYVEQPSTPLESIGLEPESFFRQDILPINGYPFRLTLAQAIRLQEQPLFQKSLIVDIDVSTTAVTPLESVAQRLQELRFIKNEVFFGVMKNAEVNFS